MVFTSYNLVFFFKVLGAYITFECFQPRNKIIVFSSQEKGKVNNAIKVLGVRVVEDEGERVSNTSFHPAFSHLYSNSWLWSVTSNSLDL